MGNAAGSMDVPLGKELKTVSPPPGSGAPQKQAAGPKLHMPAEEELEERFNAVLVSLTADDTHTQSPEYGACDGTHTTVHTPIQKQAKQLQRNKEY